MNSFRGRKLVVAFPGTYKQQTAFNVALANSVIDTRHPQTTPVFPGKTVTREDVKDCSGEYLIRQDITSRLSRLAFSFDADARLVAGWLAYAQGVAAAPTGTQTAEVWTITPTGTISGGTWKILHTFEGISDTSRDIAWNATTADIKAALEEMRTFKKGSVTVTGTLATTVVITAAGRIAAGDIAVPTLSGGTLTGGGTIAIATTTPGTSKTAMITRTNLDAVPLLSLIIGFDGDTTPPDKFKNVVVNTVTIRGTVRGKVTVDLDLFGSAATLAALAYAMPACVNINPIYTRDCRLVIDGIFVTDNLREFTYTFSNNIFTGDEAFPYDDIDVARFTHGDRTSTFSFSIYGSKGDTIYTLADNESKVPVRLIVGPPVNRVEINAPVTSVRLDDNPIAFAGEAGRSAMAITGVPFFDKDTAGTPDYVIYTGPESTAFLGT